MGSGKLLPTGRAIRRKGFHKVNIARGSRKNHAFVTVAAAGFCAFSRHCGSSYQDTWSLRFCARFYPLGIILTQERAFWLVPHYLLSNVRASKQAQNQHWMLRETLLYPLVKVAV